MLYLKRNIPGWERFIWIAAGLAAAGLAYAYAQGTIGIWMRDVDELTAPEAAERLNISIDAVKSRLHRARAMVRERLLSSGYLASAQS
jgi:hypothetical protein